MRARIKGTNIEVEVQPYYPEGMFAVFTDVSGGLQPGMCVYKTEDLDFEESFNPYKLCTDWISFRRAASVAAMQGILSCNDEEYRYLMAENYRESEKHTIPNGVAQFAVACADALIEELKKEESK